MGGGQRTPSTSSPGQHSHRYESGVSPGGKGAGVSSGKIVRADGGNIQPNDPEIRDKWITDGDLVTSDGNDVFSQCEFDAFEGTYGIQDSWHDLDSATPDAVAASEFAGGGNAINGIMDDNGNLFEEGADALQKVQVQNKIAGASNAFDADSVKSLGAKINRLRGENGGSFNFHDPEIADEFSLGEKEILANWEISGTMIDNVSEYTGSDGFMDTAVVEHGASAEKMASVLDEHGEVLVQTHNNQAVDELSETLQDRASAGDLPSNVDVDELTEKLHAQQESTHMVAVERDGSMDLQTQAESFSPARNGNSHLKGANQSLNGYDSDFSTSEIETVAQSVAESTDTAQEFETQLANTFGYQEGGHSYEESVTLPTEKTTVLQEGSGESSVEFQSAYTEDGKIHYREDGSRENPDPLPYSMDDVRCVYTETSQNSNGELEVTNVEVRSMSDFETSEVKNATTRKAKFDPSGDKIQVVDSNGEDPVSRDPAVQAASDSRDDVMNQVTSASDVNAAPEPGSVPTMDELRDDINSELFDSESGSDVFATGFGEGNDQKMTGDDAEAITKSALYDKLDSSAMEAGDDETYEFGDALRSMVEVKAYDGERVEKSGVGLGSEDPWSTESVSKTLSTEHNEWSTESVSKTLSTEHNEWSEENCTPANTRYVVLKHNTDAMGKGDISFDDVKTVAARQPSVSGDDIFKEGTESAERIQSGESSVQDEVRDEFVENMGRIEGAVIASGEAISQSDDVDLTVNKTHRVSRPGEGDSGSSGENAALDDF